MFPPSRAIDRGNLRSAGISRFIAIRCGCTGLHPSHRRLLAASFYIGDHTRLLSSRSGMLSPRTFGVFSDARLVTPTSLSCSMLSATPGCQSALVSNAPSVLPAPIIKGSAQSQNSVFSGLWVRFRAHTLHLARLTGVPVCKGNPLPGS